MVGLKANIDVLYISFSITLLCAFGRIFVSYIVLIVYRNNTRLS